MSVWVSDVREQKEIELRLYAPKSEKIRLDFNPLKLSDIPDWNPAWEEWHAYVSPLVVYEQDYTMLLMDYFNIIYPTKDAFDGTPEFCFDICFDNWIGADDWKKIITEIQKDFGGFEPDRKRFYADFLNWLEEALNYTDIIVVEGNQ